MSKEVADLDYFEMDLYEHRHKKCWYCQSGFNKRSKIIRLVGVTDCITFSELVHERCIRGWKDLRYLFE